MISKTIKCLLCKKYFQKLESHLFFTHDIMPKQYLKKFPSASLISEHSKIKHSKLMKRYFADPNNLKKMSARVRTYFKEHPEARKRISVFWKKYYSIPDNLGRMRARRVEFFKKHPDEKRKHSLAMKHYFSSASVRREHSLLLREYYKTHPEELLRLSLQGKKYYREHSEAAKAHAKLMKIIMGAPKARRSMSRTKIKYYEDHPELSKVHSKFMQKYYSDPKNLETMRRRVKRYYETHPEVLIQMSLRAKEYYRKHPEARLKLSQSILRLYKERPEIKEKISKSVQKLYENPLFTKRLKEALSLKPNKQEQYLIQLFRKKRLPLKYVGDWSFFIGSKNPDFISAKRRKVVEFFGDYWHGKIITGKDKNQEELDKINYYKKKGYKCLIIWEHEIKNQDAIVNKVKGFLAK